MLGDQDIQQALHARRVVPVSVPNPHGPLGLEHVLGAVTRIADSPLGPPDEDRIRRPISLSVPTWEKLSRLADAVARASSRPVSATEIATAIIEQSVAMNP